MNIIKDIKNENLKRREMKVVVAFEKNPGIAEAIKVISDVAKSSADLIVIKKLKSKFGRNTFLIDSFIYNSVEDRNMIEPKVKVKKAGGAK